MEWKVPLFKIYHDPDDELYVSRAIEKGMNWAIGEQVTEFENDIRDYLGTKYCLSLNSGTSALHALMMAYGISSGDEVIVPSFTFIATANAAQFVGAKPVFADIEDVTNGLDPDDVNEKITSRTKAIVPVHFGGCPCQVRELREIADDHGIVLIEDAAESFGATVDSKMTGTFGDASILSFCQNKIISTGDGGAVITDSRDIAEKVKLIRSHGRLETADYFSSTAIFDYITLGFNFRMSNITAALGCAQMMKVDRIIGMRRKVAATYTRELKDLPGSPVRVPAEPPGNAHVYQLFSIIAQNRDGLIKHLESRGIMSKIYFSPVHKTYYYKDVLHNSPSLPVTERVSDSIMSLPIYPGMKEEEICCVTDAIREFYRGES